MICRLLVVVGIALAASAFLVADVGTASAEMQLAQAQKRPNLFERLFGIRKKAAPQEVEKTRRSRATSRERSATGRSTGRGASAPAVAAPAIEPKDPDARKILVVGDFVASGLAAGLEEHFAEEPMVAVLDRSSPSSGLVRVDHYDWNQELLGILNEVNPDIVVVGLGANDRQDMRVEGQVVGLRSPAWDAVYGERVDGLVDTLGVYGRPFFWLGAPPLRGRSATADMAYLNDIYRPRVAAAGGHFVDVWNGFADADGQYVSTGPDIEGQTRALRTSDGINFTRAGRNKLAFYVAREMRLHTGIGTGTVDLLASISRASTIEVGPDGVKRLVGPVISLADAPPGADQTLAGPPDPVAFDPVSRTFVRPPPRSVAGREEDTARYRLVVGGEAPPPLPGRADDFSWPPSERKTQDFRAPDAEAGASPAAAGGSAGSDRASDAGDQALTALPPLDPRSSTPIRVAP